MKTTISLKIVFANSVLGFRVIIQCEDFALKVFRSKKNWPPYFGNTIYMDHV